MPTVASEKNFKGIERDFLVPAGKRLNRLIRFIQFAERPEPYTKLYKVKKGYMDQGVRTCMEQVQDDERKNCCVFFFKFRQPCG